MYAHIHRYASPHMHAHIHRYAPTHMHAHIHRYASMHMHAHIHKSGWFYLWLSLMEQRESLTLTPRVVCYLLQTPGIAPRCLE